MYAWMIFIGMECRLQICSGLTPEWFDSTFLAIVFVDGVPRLTHSSSSHTQFVLSHTQTVLPSSGTRFVCASNNRSMRLQDVWFAWFSFFFLHHMFVITILIVMHCFCSDIIFNINIFLWHSINPIKKIL